LSTKIKVGDKALDFTLPDIDMNPRRLGDFLGTGQKILLAFSVNDFTAQCTKESCEFRDFATRLIDLNTNVVGISAKDLFMNADFVEKNRLCFPVLWDYKREVFRNYGLCGKEAGEYESCRFPMRSILILDSNGVVNYRWESDDPTAEPNYQEIQRLMKEEQAPLAIAR